MRTVVYTCSLGRYDWVNAPLAATPGAEFVRVSDLRRSRLGLWRHRDAPDVAAAGGPLLLARRMKLFPEALFPEADLSIWVDGNIQILADLTPLIEEFRESGADIALLRHSRGRTVGEELTRAAEVGRIPPEHHALIEPQCRRYAEAGVLDRRVNETSILFRRHGSPALRAVTERWWAEISTYTRRDQVSLPFAMTAAELRVHGWCWHFANPGAPWFRRVEHRPRAPLRRLRLGAHFQKAHVIEYAALDWLNQTTRPMRVALGLKRPRHGAPVPHPCPRKNGVL